jgi:hypothetical protein
MSPSKVTLTPSPSWADRVLRWSSVLLAAVVWASALLFGLYILAFYAMAFARGAMAKWNGNLPGLYAPELPVATVGVGLHFAAGGLILVLGGIQLLAPLRRRLPSVHRWIGRVYALACAITALGGLAFIGAKGTIGGPIMNVGFGLYGVLMLLAAIETVRHAWAGRLELHRAWGIRLFALAIGSWLYRMELGFWLLFTDGLGHASNFRGPVDHILSFFFYIPNLLVAEIVIRRTRFAVAAPWKWIASLVVLVANGFLLAGTGYFTYHYWGPAIVALFRDA